MHAIREWLPGLLLNLGHHLWIPTVAGMLENWDLQDMYTYDELGQGS